MCFVCVPCFTSFVDVLRARFASTTRSAFRSRSRSGLLLLRALLRSRRSTQPSVRHFACFVFPGFLLGFALPLPWRRRSLPFLVPFSQEEHRANTGGPGPRLLRAFPMCLPLAAFAGAQSPAIEKKIALRALSAFGAINSTPGGREAAICTNKSTWEST